MTRWVHRSLPRVFAPRNAKRYAKPRGALPWTTGTTSVGNKGGQYCTPMGGQDSMPIDSPNVTTDVGRSPHQVKAEFKKILDGTKPRALVPR